jgi:hypothetical protein
VVTWSEEQRPTENCSSKKGDRVLIKRAVEAGLLGGRRGCLSPGPILAWILDLQDIYMNYDSLQVYHV